MDAAESLAVFNKKPTPMPPGRGTPREGREAKSGVSRMVVHNG